MKIIYCHHAQRDNHRLQTDGLTKNGIKDAKNYAAIFADAQKNHQVVIKAIYTSPYFRCRQTAEIINKKLKVPIIDEVRFNEFDTNRETWVDLQNRVIAAINDITAKYQNDDAIICVTSGVNVGAFICWNFKIAPSPNTPTIGVTSCSPLIFNFEK